MLFLHTGYRWSNGTQIPVQLAWLPDSTQQQLQSGTKKKIAGARSIWSMATSAGYAGCMHATKDCRGSKRQLVYTGAADAVRLNSDFLEVIMECLGRDMLDLEWPVCAVLRRGVVVVLIDEALRKGLGALLPFLAALEDFWTSAGTEGCRAGCCWGLCPIVDG